MISLRFLAVNRASIMKYGYTRKEFLSMTLEDIRPKEEVSSLRNHFKKLRRTKHSDKFIGAGIWKHRKKNGEIIYADINTSNILYDNTNAILVIANDITAKKVGGDILKSHNIELKKLAEHLQKIREDERNKISHDIHDHLGQQLNVLKVEVFLLAKKIASSNNEFDRDQALKELLSIQDLIDSSIKSIHKIVMDLRPEVLEKLGLIEAVRWHSEEFEKRTGIKCKVNISFRKIDLSKERSVAIYRIFQEILTNVAKHSFASEVVIRLQKSNKRLILTVKDDGTGMNKDDLVKRHAFGISGMKERANSINGKFKIINLKRKGTKVELRFPTA